MGVADPVVVDSERGGCGGSRSVSRLVRFWVEPLMVELGSWLLLLPVDRWKRCEVRGVTIGVSKLGPSSLCWRDS